MTEHKDDSLKTGIKLTGWDPRGAVGEDNVANFTIKDPRKQPDTKNEYCIGYKFLGGDLTNSQNWEYDHTNYWGDDSNLDVVNIDTDSILVPREELDQMLQQYGISADELLAQYCNKLKDIK